MGRPALTEMVVQMFTTSLVVNMFNTFKFSLELVRFYQKSTFPLLHFVHFYSFLISGASTDNLPPGVLYKVKATYKYQAEDMDELAFEVGEIIDVIEYEDPEEQVRQWNMVRNYGNAQHSMLQEEGWLMGVKDSTGQKGLFPANFTKPI